MATQTLTYPQAGDLYAPRTSAPAPITPIIKPRTRLYKEYLTPALHGRFTKAAGGILVVCWLEAYILSNSDHLFWSWFPLSLTGLRALLLFVPCLTVFIVRVANIHIGEQLTTSPVESMYAHVASVNPLIGTAITFGWYIFGAWFYGEVYIWSKTEEAMLGWVDPGRAFERPRLNENPIALRCVFVIAGVVQAAAHLHRDYDRLRIPTTEKEVPKEKHRRPNDPPSNDEASLVDSLPRPLQELWKQLATVLNRIGLLCAYTLIFGFNATYWKFLRGAMWTFMYAIGRTVFRDLPTSAPPSGFVNLPTLIWQAASASVMLGLLWELSNVIFDIYVAQPPLRKNHAALTSQVKSPHGIVTHVSKNPNGSLLTGLKSKKEVPKSFAFWELYLICVGDAARRKTLYTDVDTPEESVWSQICKCSLAEIEKISQRIKTAHEPVGFTNKQKLAELQRIQYKDLIASVPDEQLGLRSIADQTVRHDADVFAKQKPDLLNTIGNLARSVGQSPGADPLAPRARKAIQWSADQTLSKQTQQNLTRQHLDQRFGTYATRFLQTPLGEPFRRTFARTARAVIFGVPHSSKVNIHHAAQALSHLAVYSLKEDDYGQVAKDVPKIVRTFTETITAVEKLVRELAPHWTDVYFTEEDRKTAEVMELLGVLKTALETVMLAFGEYASGLGLSKKEVREANEAVARKGLQPAIEMKEAERGR